MRAKLLTIALGTGLLACITILFVFGGASVLAEQLRLFIRAAPASIFFRDSVTVRDLQERYEDARSERRPVRVLIVPGHQPERGGAEYGSLAERDVVVEIAEELAGFLEDNRRYEVMIARDKEAWHPTLAQYFAESAAKIEAFRVSQTEEMARHLAEGSILPEADQVYHNEAPTAAALQLYGINLWTNENDYHITLHLHLNDYAGRRSKKTYDGFAIYVPDDQFSNGRASKALGEALAARLNVYHATSTLPKEDKGVVEDQELIAVGSNNTADNAALLIEYAYIYEPQFQDATTRAYAVRDYAYQTYLGLQDFFEDPILSRGSAAFSRGWTRLLDDSSTGPGVYALQAALRYLGFYPPSGKSFSECPISGTAGECTEEAVREYQRSKGLEETGAVGPQTREQLARDTLY